MQKSITDLQNGKETNKNKYRLTTTRETHAYKTKRVSHLRIKILKQKIIRKSKKNIKN